ncbi:MAG: hypothetical protein OQK24_03625 [Magnetovibrio sp.]|nr:hypothetical protein [Magnetovibrio sp.]
MMNIFSDLGGEGIPTLFVVIGVLMLSWIFFLGDMILPLIQ